MIDDRKQTVSDALSGLLPFLLIPRVAICLLLGSVAVANAATFQTAVAPLIDASCIDCHDTDTDTQLNFDDLSHDLANPETFRQWESIYDRVQNGEMPPKKKRRPNPAIIDRALTSLRTDLRAANVEFQKKYGRVPVRRLTGTEYEYTLHDLLGIHTQLAKHLPPENESSRFDTLATGQGLAPVHIRSYLAAADLALDAAIKLGRRPQMEPRLVDYQNNKYVARWFDRPIRKGGGTIKKIANAVVTFEPRPHALRSDHMGFRFRESGQYRIEAEAYAYQATTPVTLLIMRSSDKQGGSEMLAYFDLHPDKTRKVSVTAYLTPEDYIYPSVADLDTDSNGQNILATGAADYEGEGIAIKSLTVQGPLEDTWPPSSTRQLLPGIEFVQRGNLPRGGHAFDTRLHKSPMEHVSEITASLAPRLFRRPVEPCELDSIVRLAEPALAEGYDFIHAVRIPLRTLLCSPQFLFHSGDAGELDDFALASRLSYFLWKTFPDDELFRLAREKILSDPQTLAAQVTRMLDDEKSMRFIRDFLDQWVGLKDIDATTPDDKLYPEYDDVLRHAMLRETELFFRELIAENLPVRNLIDSSFTFLNRRLAEHYGIYGIDGEHFRRVPLPRSRVRGGLLTQASVLKVTANGTVTSPVKRGAFVLTTLLGRPPKPPPLNIQSIDPDTRGTTTIRETLDKHRNAETCASCHREIDPQGFALESFDPIGGYRTRYRSTGKGDWPTRKLFGRRIYEYREGPAVDASGMTADGKPFAGIREFKRILLTQEEAVARNLISTLIVYATGAEIQFADREEVDRLLASVASEDYRVRDIIQQIVQSQIFRNK